MRRVLIVMLLVAVSGCASQSEAWAHMGAGLVELRAAVRQHGELSRPAEGVHPAAWAAEAAAIDAAFAEGIAAAAVGAEEVDGDE